MKTIKSSYLSDKCGQAAILTRHVALVSHEQGGQLRATDVPGSSHRLGVAFSMLAASQPALLMSLCMANAIV
jgi:hypothetical protein